MPLPEPIYASGDFTEAVACSAPVFSKPFPGINIDYVLKQEFMRYWNDRTPLAIGTAHPDFADFKLVEESEPVVDGGIERWTRTYAKLPAAFTQPTQINYTFIGYWPGQAVIVDGVLQEGRARFSEVVPAEITFDFFEADSIDDVTVIPAQKYGYQNDTGIPYPDYNTTDLLWEEGRIANVDTNPTLEQYLNWFEGEVDEQKIVAQDSSVERWLGNIYMRQTIRIWPR